ncbi:hypothetical protein [Conexibacter woesei]|uniref:Uncharacterized protein n=1 Tax=Conexibacter woesei (strain DSM 14684 / CCUG 47730 / CIP 108061 / JCM 11494 / NBRC 100937 / ID131577) TaxID=469383 RepID=D3F7Z1_CONWI|nr:hypothetical protein [Conexibacter woesei]ADB52885.1 hypothetical protein Cwoe_4472 [Conexibacter woesei DSM 14684]
MSGRRRAQLVDRDVLGRVGFTDHAIERFAERAGLDTAQRRAVEPIARDLLMQEGRVVGTPPAWYRSSNTADGYLQTGDWLLFVCRASRRRASAYDVVTVLCNGDSTTWSRALDRRLIYTPPPLPAAPAPRRRRVGWAGSIVAGLRLRRERGGIGRLEAIRQAHRERRHAASAAGLEADRAAYDAARRRHREARERARERHVRMWG